MTFLLLFPRLAAATTCYTLVAETFITSPVDGDVVPPGFIIRGPALQLLDADGASHDLAPQGLGEWATPDDLPLGLHTIEGLFGDRLTIEVADVEPLEDVAPPVVTDAVVTRERDWSLLCPEDPEHRYVVAYEMPPVDQDGWAVGLVDEAWGVFAWTPATGDGEVVLSAGAYDDLCPTLVVSDPRGAWVHTEALPCAGCGGCASRGAGGGWLGLLALGLLRRRRP
ncbi:MAG: hypothetical protein H6739_21645 [Alphaproteobacteria bacterium]|nr:hypothetical protein [Alphaproteobacteria bacterium]